MKSKIDKELMFKKYSENKTYAQIARELGFDRSYITRAIKKCVANGELAERPKMEKIPRVRKPRTTPRPKAEPKPKTYVKPKIVREYPPTYDYPVECDRERSRNCVYGRDRSNMSTLYTCNCNYLLCTNHSRGCPPNRCTKFVQVDKDHEKLLPKLFRSAINGDKKL